MTTFIRSSTLAAWPDCERRTASKVFSKIIAEAGYKLTALPNSIPAAIGTAVHAGAALTLREKLESGKLAPLDAVEDCGVESINEAIKLGANLTDEVPTPSIAEKVVRRMTRMYQARIAPTIEPIAVEERLEVQTDTGIIISGQSDVIARVKDAVHDLKTGARRGNYKPQLGSYSLLAKAHGINVDHAIEDWLPRVKHDKAQPEPQVFSHDVPAAETAALNIINRIAYTRDQFLENGDPWAFMANPSSMLCSEKFCPAFGTQFCIEHKEKTK